MPRALTVRWGWLLITFGISTVWGSAWGQPPRDADPRQVSYLEFRLTPAGKIQSLIRSWPENAGPEIFLAVRYQHPMVQLLVYSPDQAGPEGTLLLPQGQQFQAGLTFSYSTIKKDIPFHPAQSDCKLRLAISPGRLQETWQFANDVRVIRSYYQAQSIPAVVTRFMVVNRGSRKLSGFRVNANLIQPQLLGPPEESPLDGEWENDFRTGAVYGHRATQGNEAWMALAWSPAGGLIRSEAGGPYGEHRPSSTMTMSSLTLETPAMDLEPQQPRIFEFIQTWGLDRQSVIEQVAHLRATSDYSAWNARQEALEAKGLVVASGDPTIDYFFRVLKGWAPWQMDEQQHRTVIYPTMASNVNAHPEMLAMGLRGLLALGYSQYVKQYLNQWLDQRQESVDSVYLIHMIYDYIAFSADFTWLRGNAFRIQELMNYIDSLDDDQDSLPNFRIALEPKGAVEPDEPVYRVQDTDLQLSQYSMASILAYRYLHELYELLANPEYKHLLAVLDEKNKKAETVLAENYWTNQLGEKGFYAYGRLDDRDIILDIAHISAINAYILNIGPPALQAAVFHECWTNPLWRTDQGFYRSFLKDELSPNTILPVNENSYDIGYTYRVLLAGLITPVTAQEALQQFKVTSKQMLLNPKQCGLPGDSGMTARGLSVSAFTYIPLILRGLGGLKITPRGIVVTRPLAGQALHIDNLPVQHKLLSLAIEPDLGKAPQLTINGHRQSFDTLIDLKQYKNNLIAIKIERKASKKNKKKLKREINVKRRK